MNNEYCCKDFESEVNDRFSRRKDGTWWATFSRTESYDKPRDMDIFFCPFCGTRVRKD